MQLTLIMLLILYFSHYTKTPLVIGRTSKKKLRKVLWTYLLQFVIKRSLGYGHCFAIYEWIHEIGSFQKKRIVSESLFVCLRSRNK